MNAMEFVNAVRSEVRDAATQGTILLLERPPSRHPARELAELSQWFNALSADDRSRVREVAAEASHQATFGVLCVLDGVRVIEDAAVRGKLELRHLGDGESVILNDPTGPLLHDML